MNSRYQFHLGSHFFFFHFNFPWNIKSLFHLAESIPRSQYPVIWAVTSVLVYVWFIFRCRVIIIVVCSVIVIILKFRKQTKSRETAIGLWILLFGRSLYNLLSVNSISSYRVWLYSLHIPSTSIFFFHPKVWLNIFKTNYRLCYLLIFSYSVYCKTTIISEQYFVL